MLFSMNLGMHANASSARDSHFSVGNCQVQRLCKQNIHVYSFESNDSRGHARMSGTCTYNVRVQACKHRSTSLNHTWVR